MIRRLGWVLLLLLLGAWLASDAAACPVCFDAEEEARQAYAATTAMLTLLPLALVGSAALWVRHRLKLREAALPPG